MFRAWRSDLDDEGLATLVDVVDRAHALSRTRITACSSLPALIETARDILRNPLAGRYELRRVGMMALSGLIGVLRTDLPPSYAHARSVLVDLSASEEALRYVSGKLVDILELRSWDPAVEWIVLAALEPVYGLREEPRSAASDVAPGDVC
jgi:hypothetical protein